MPRLARLLAANRARAVSSRILSGFRPSAYDPDGDGDADKPGAPGVDSDGVATIYLYDAIGGWWGVTAADLVPQIAALDATTIHLRINSPGGDVFDARAIKTALEAHKARVVAHVDGLAASAASFVMLAADEIEISEGAFVMIHNPWTLSVGDARDMRAAAALLDQVGGAICRDYARKTGADAAALQAMMDAETWLESHDAVAQGFCDRLAAKPAKAAARFNLEAFDNAPAALADAAAPETGGPDAALAAMRARQERLLAIYERAPA